MSQLLISHRGNINGAFDSWENEPTYIEMAISGGYDVEVDIWYRNNMLWLGHDGPMYGGIERWLKKHYNKLWIHCKNIEALNYFKNLNENVNYFWHQTDDFTLTSNGLIWTYPGKELTSNSIAVLPEVKEFDNIEIAYGICSDFVEKYKN